MHSMMLMQKAASECVQDAMDIWLPSDECCESSKAANVTVLSGARVGATGTLRDAMVPPPWCLQGPLCWAGVGLVELLLPQ